MTSKPSQSANAALAVCSWSLLPAGPEDLARKMQACGLNRVQLALDPLREDPAVWDVTEKLFQQHSITIVSGMFACVGEDYTTLDSIRRTGGIVPDATWEQNRRNIREVVVLAKRLGLNLVTFHAGALPHDDTDPAYATMLLRLGEVADMFAAENITLGLETGQESAPALAALLRRLDRPNLGVNFDPANVILYNQGEPIEALRQLAAWLRQIHIKDATRTKVVGTWGEEVPVGTGDVDWPTFFATLRELNYQGDLVIEREAGAQRILDIKTARAIVEKNLIPQNAV